MEEKAEVRRDRWGRYMVLPPGESTPVGYTRATTVAKTLDDQQGLIDWGKRMVALGLGTRPDLLALVQGCTPDDKKQLNSICERAAEAGGATSRRDLGTAWHSFAERAAQDPDWLPPAPYDRDIAAMRDELRRAGLTIVPEYLEQMMVNDEWAIAGTADLVLTDGEELYFADYKTGSSVTLGALGFAIQLAIYANCNNIYRQHSTNAQLDERLPMPKVNKSTGVIIHIEPGSGKCDLYWLDLEIGAEALELAMGVRAMRKQKPLVKIQPTAQVKAEQIVERVAAGHISSQARQAICDRVAALVAAGHADLLAGRWPENTPTPKTGEPYTEEQADKLRQMLSIVEKIVEAPFPAPEPAVEAEYIKKAVADVPRGPVDEGATMTDADIEYIKEATALLEPESKEWLAETVKSASRAKKNIRLTGPGGKITERRILIADALCEAAIQRDDLLFRAMLEQVIEAPVFPEDIGRIVGNLTITQAKKLRGCATLINQGLLVPTWFEDHVELN